MFRLRSVDVEYDVIANQSETHFGNGSLKILTQISRLKLSGRVCHATKFTWVGIWVDSGSWVDSVEWRSELRSYNRPLVAMMSWITAKSAWPVCYIGPRPNLFFNTWHYIYMNLAVKVDLQYLRRGHSNGGDRTHCCCVTPLLHRVLVATSGSEDWSLLSTRSRHITLSYMSLPASDLGPHPLNGSLDSRESAPQTASWSVQSVSFLSVHSRSAALPSRPYNQDSFGVHTGST